MERNWGEFEGSKTDRRQMLRALGLIATGACAASVVPKAAAAFAASAAQSAAGGGKVFPVTTVNHLALAAANYAKSRDFYLDLFGMRVAWDDGNQCALEFGSHTSPNGMYIRPLRPGEKPTVGHIAFGIPNFMSHKAAMKAELERRGVKNIRPDGEKGWSCDDPAGYLLNVWVPEKDKAMFPGAAGPCAVAASEKCKAAWQAGQKNLHTAPKPSGQGFQPIGYSFIVLNVPDVAKERDFYRDLLGMKVIYDQSQKPNGECFLGFGHNGLVLRKLSNPAGKPYCNQFGFAVGITLDDVEAELNRRAFKPKRDSKYSASWTIVDPDGYQVGVSGSVPAIALLKGSSVLAPRSPDLTALAPDSRTRAAELFSDPAGCSDR
jgi:catechol 2,3-dioxygenase-like lactoylglutathione lyase family enzyme